MVIRQFLENRPARRAVSLEVDISMDDTDRIFAAIERQRLADAAFDDVLTVRPTKKR